MKESSQTKVEKAPHTHTSAHQCKTAARNSVPAPSQAKLYENESGRAHAECCRSELTESVELIVRNWDISPQFDANAGGRGTRNDTTHYAI